MCVGLLPLVPFLQATSPCTSYLGSNRLAYSLYMYTQELERELGALEDEAVGAVVSGSAVAGEQAQDEMPEVNSVQNDHPVMAAVS